LKLILSMRYYDKQTLLTVMKPVGMVLVINMLWKIACYNIAGTTIDKLGIG